MCALLSLLYGKRFDAHGAVQSHGHFMLPNFGQFNSLCIPKLPQNDHNPRSDISVPLDLRQVERIRPVLTGQAGDAGKATALNSAAKFYWQALQNAEEDSEVAYIHLITAGEILANTHRPENDDDLDEEIRAVLDQVKKSVPDGLRLARILSSRMRQIKRRFRLTAEDLADERFFNIASSAPEWAKFTRDNFSKCVSAAYNIRSNYVHSGESFGRWIAPRGDYSEEIRHGMPDVDAAPTYVGLERLIRYCLIRFAERYQLFVR